MESSRNLPDLIRMWHSEVASHAFSLMTAAIERAQARKKSGPEMRCRTPFPFSDHSLLRRSFGKRPQLTVRGLNRHAHAISTYRDDPPRAYHRQRQQRFAKKLRMIAIFRLNVGFRPVESGSRMSAMGRLRPDRFRRNGVVAGHPHEQFGSGQIRILTLFTQSNTSRPPAR